MGRGLARRERFTNAVTPFLLDALALRPGERVLDIGCGGGLATLAAAEIVEAEGFVLGADLSAPITRLAEQRKHDAGATNVSFVVVDMQTDDIDGVTFDVAMSQFGVMFFDEPVTAFQNIARHLERGGRMAFACWRSLAENPWFFATAIAHLLPAPPPADPTKSPTGPFALADPDRTAGILESSGFVDVRRTPHDLLVETAEDSVVDDSQLTFIGVPESEMAAASAAVSNHMSQFKIDGGLSRFPLAFQIFEARRP